MNRSDDRIPAELEDFLDAFESDGSSAEERLDRLVARVPGKDLVKGVETLLAEGDPRRWPAALLLVGLLGGENDALWDRLIDAIENREDLDWPELMEGIAMLKLQRRLPESGRCRELADEWAEAADSEATDLRTLLDLMDDDAEMPPVWLRQIAQWSEEERSELRSELAAMEPSRSRDLLLAWLDTPKADEAAERQRSHDDDWRGGGLTSHTDAAWELAESLPLFWVSDLALDGTFGGGLETREAMPRRILVAGSTSDGIRFLEAFEVDPSVPFVPELPEPRRVSTHPQLVRHWLAMLANIGFAPSASGQIAADLLFDLKQELAASEYADLLTWETWTRTLVENNPRSAKPDALRSDAETTLDAIAHWLVVDELAAELASEFRSHPLSVSGERLQGAIRVWFERSLGPRMGRVLVNLQAMGYFWLSMAESDPVDQERWVTVARASARIAADLSDPSRVVASHPFVEIWARRVFEKAASAEA